MPKRTTKHRRRSHATESIFNEAPEAAAPLPAQVVSELPREGHWGVRDYALVACLIGGVCAMLYAWTVNFPMVFDDYVYLQTNPLVRDGHSFGYLADLKEFVQRPAKIGLPEDLATNFVLRPVAYATFYLNFVLDGYRPLWYHAFNVLIHGINGFLIFFLVRTLLLGARSLSRTSQWFIPLFASLLFVAHPMATESVTYIVQRFTSLEVTFCLAALCLHFRLPGVKSKLLRWGMRAASVLLLIMGMLTKEAAITIPFMAVMIDWLVVRNTLVKSLRSALPMLLCTPIIPVTVLFVSWARHGNEVTLGHAVNITNLNDQPWDHWQYLVTQFTVVASYLRRLVWPVGLNIDPEWPLYKTLFSWPVVRSLLVMAAMLATAGGLALRWRADIRSRLTLAFVLWFFATIVISSGLVPLPDLMAEHRAYLPSIGILVGLACLADWVRSWNGLARTGRWLVPAGAAAVIMALCVSTVKRNFIWSSAVTLWQDTTAKSPGNARAWGNLGAALTSNNRYDEAIPCYEKAIELDHQYQTAYLNLASVLNAKHRSKEALDVIERLLALGKGADRSPDVQCNRAIAFIESGRVDDGMRILNAIAEQKPDHRMTHVVLGMVYGQTSRPKKALEQYQMAVNLEPADANLMALIKAAESAATGALATAK